MATWGVPRSETGNPSPSPAQQGGRESGGKSPSAGNSRVVLGGRANQRGSETLRDPQRPPVGESPGVGRGCSCAGAMFRQVSGREENDWAASCPVLCGLCLTRGLGLGGLCVQVPAGTPARGACPLWAPREARAPGGLSLSVFYLVRGSSEFTVSSTIYLEEKKPPPSFGDRAHSPQIHSTALPFCRSGAGTSPPRDVPLTHLSLSPPPRMAPLRCWLLWLALALGSRTQKLPTRDEELFQMQIRDKALLHDSSVIPDGAEISGYLFRDTPRRYAPSGPPSRGREPRPGAPLRREGPAHAAPPPLACFLSRGKMGVPLRSHPGGLFLAPQDLLGGEGQFLRFLHFGMATFFSSGRGGGGVLEGLSKIKMRFIKYM